MTFLIIDKLFKIKTKKLKNLMKSNFSAGRRIRSSTQTRPQKFQDRPQTQLKNGFHHNLKQDKQI